jgi:hypothetical protein
MMEEEPKTGRKAIHKILLEDLRKHMICARFALYCFTNEQQALRKQACQEFIQSVDNDSSFFDSVVMAVGNAVILRSPNKKTRHGMALIKLSKKQKMFISKLKKKKK